MLVNIFPQLKTVYRKQHQVKELFGEEAQKRFTGVLKSVVQSLKHIKVVLVLDDIQWADTSSLRFMPQLVSLQNVFFVGAYRDNEVKQAHPLLETLKAIQVPSVHFYLQPPEPAEMNKLTMESLHFQDPSETMPLTEQIILKTAGNPLFFVRYLTSLVDQGLIYYSIKSNKWEWDLQKIMQKEILTVREETGEGEIYLFIYSLLNESDQKKSNNKCRIKPIKDVVDLLLDFLKKCTPNQQLLLKLASYCGQSFTPSLIVDIASSLGEKVFQDDFLHLKTENYLVATSSDQSSLERKYSFAHDKIQQASHNLFSSSSEKARYQLRIGEYLAKLIESEKETDKVFVAVMNINSGRALSLCSPAELLGHIAINMKACSICRESSDYEKALQYSNVVQDIISQIGEEAMWGHAENAYYETILDALAERQEILYFTNSIEEADRCYEKIMIHAKNLTDKFKGFHHKLSLIERMQDLPQLIAQSIRFLDEHGLLSIRMNEPYPEEETSRAYGRVKQALLKDNFKPMFAERKMEKLVPEMVENIVIMKVCLIGFLLFFTF